MDQEEEIVKRFRNKIPPKITQKSPSPSQQQSPSPSRSQQSQEQSQEQDLQFYQVSKNIRNKDRIVEKISVGYRARRKPCRVEAHDKANLNLFFEQMGIVLYDIPVKNEKSKLNVLIPTVVLKQRDEDRRRTLIQNIDIYLYDPSIKVVLFFNRNQPGYAEYFEFLTEEFTVEEKKQITYVTYVHNPIDASGDRTKSHVGRARAAIGLFMLNHLSPDAMVVITDDRRYLGEPKREKNEREKNEGEEKEIGERVDEIIDYINITPDTIVSPISQLAFHRDREIHFVDDTYHKTYMMAQIYFGKAGTFSNIYACALMNNAKCEITKKGLKTTPVLASCFARLFEDCAFISAGYDNKFNMVSYTHLARRTPGDITTMARATADFTTLQALDYNQLMQSVESCLVQVRDDTKYIRWGAHIDGIKKLPKRKNDGSKNKTDPYEYHHACFSARDKLSRKCKDLAAEFESLSIEPQVVESRKLREQQMRDRQQKANELASIQLAKKLQQQQQQQNNANAIRKLRQQDNEFATRNFLKQQQQKQQKQSIERKLKEFREMMVERRKAQAMVKPKQQDKKLATNNFLTQQQQKQRNQSHDRKFKEFREMMVEKRKQEQAKAKAMVKSKQQYNELATRIFFQSSIDQRKFEREMEAKAKAKAKVKPRRKASPKKYIIEELLFRETNIDKVKGYRVKWKDYPESANTFEPLSNLVEDVPEMIEEDIALNGPYV